MGCTDQILMNYGVDYDKVTPSEIEDYDLVVLEPEQYTVSEVSELAKTDTRIIGYISMSEVNPHRWYYPLLREIGFLGVNENWNSPYIDLSSPKARSILLDEVARSIMAKGFDGLLLDTIDGVAPYTERSHLQDEMLGMIRTLNERYPEAYIIQNRGLFLLQDTDPLVDAIMIEDIATHYDFETENYNLRSVQDYRETVRWMRSFADTLGKPVLILDYAVEEDMKREVIQRLDTLNQPYYISNIQLDTLEQVYQYRK
ncbi:MAG: endo alpha-1,4 polygalactosaminidase [Balneolaceae bacterium]|nr:endo alpha-1,4 polygalactosaminidase [Balneolaceae bacterium]